MRVSLAPSYRKLAEAAPEQRLARLLEAGGARVILGQGPQAPLAAPIAASPHSLFGPRGACLAAPDGPLFVCDTGHHRLRIFRQAPGADNAAADRLIEQPDFRGEARNAKGAIRAARLNVPTGIAAADVVIGQKDFMSGLANGGTDSVGAVTLNWCYGVAIADGRLFVADTGNRRVLVWNAIPTRNGTPADLVLGQRDFTTRDENAGQSGSALGMRWPHDIAVSAGMLMVADAGNNRVMIWRSLPQSNGVACDCVLGQADVNGLDHNRAAYYPTASALNMPYGLAVQHGLLIVADTANSRLVGFDHSDLSMGAEATRLAGQDAATDKGDNRWQPATRDSLCWPYDVAGCGDTLVIAESGNNRILLWEAAP